MSLVNTQNSKLCDTNNGYGTTLGKCLNRLHSSNSMYRIIHKC